MKKGKFSKKIQNILKQIWGSEVAQQLKNFSTSFPGKKLEELDNKQISIELSLKGHQCLFT